MSPEDAWFTRFVVLPPLALSVPIRAAIRIRETRFVKTA